MVDGFRVALDDNKRPFEAVRPKTGYRLTGTETTTVRTNAVVTTGLVRICPVAAINVSITTSTTDAVTTSDVYIPAGHVEYFSARKDQDYVAFLGSTVVYITIMQ
jgi:hypothetical protein